MEDIFLNISPEVYMLFAINLFLIIVLFFMNLSNKSKIQKLKDKYYRFMTGSEDMSIEQLLEDYISKVDTVVDKSKNMESHINHIERNLIQCVQKVGIVRYNAFENVGSDLSFSIAMLDNTDTGIILSGIYSRDSSSTYAKPVVSGKSKYILSAEELQALDIAKKSHGERLYVNK